MSTSRPALALVAAALLLPALSACGGGGSDDPGAGTAGSGSTATLPPVGVYDVDYGQFSGTYAFVDDGRFYGVHFVEGSVLAGHPHGPLSSSNSTASMEPIAWANFIDDAHMLGAQEQHGLFGRSFSGTSLSTRISGSMGTFNATAAAQKTYSATDTRTIYDHPLPMSTVAGTYRGIVRTVGPQQPQASVTDFTVAGGGAFTATAIGCSFSGKMAAHGATGLFDAQAATTGSACGFTAALKGVVVPLGLVNDKPQLAFELDSDDNQQTAVFVVTKQ